MAYLKREDQIAASRRHYLKHREKIKVVNAVKRDLDRKSALAFLRVQKGVPCLDCGLRFPHYVMDFDHVRGSKCGNVSRMATSGRPLDALRAEIDKCEIVCSNCHRIRTYSRIHNPVWRTGALPLR